MVKHINSNRQNKYSLLHYSYDGFSGVCYRRKKNEAPVLGASDCLDYIYGYFRSAIVGHKADNKSLFLGLSMVMHRQTPNTEQFSRTSVF